MKDRRIGVVSKSKAILQEKWTDFGYNDVDIHRASVVLQFFPFEILRDCLLNPPDGQWQLEHVIPSAADVLSKVPRELTLRLQVAKGSNGLTVSKPQIERGFDAFYHFLK